MVAEHPLLDVGNRLVSARYVDGLVLSVFARDKFRMFKHAAGWLLCDVVSLLFHACFFFPGRGVHVQAVSIGISSAQNHHNHGQDGRNSPVVFSPEHEQRYRERWEDMRHLLPRPGQVRSLAARTMWRFQPFTSALNVVLLRQLYTLVIGQRQAPEVLMRENI